MEDLEAGGIFGVTRKMTNKSLQRKKATDQSFQRKKATNK
jgi:hypothetical protein